MSVVLYCIVLFVFVHGNCPVPREILIIIIAGLFGQFIDGWENQGQVFPSDEDYPYDISERYQLFCGDQQPTEFLSSQNVAMLQFKIPTRGQGFLVRINLVKNLTRT